MIDQLKLRQNPEFNPALAKPSFWADLNPQQYLPIWVQAWFNPPSARNADANKAAGNPDDLAIDILLARVDVSTLGRSHVLSVKAELRNPQTASAIANALAERYLDYQRRDKIDAMDRVDKFLLSRVNELREAVRKSDQAVEDYRRKHDLYKSSGVSGSGGVTTQQLTELNSQLLAAQTAKAEVESRLKEAQEMRKGGLNGESVPEVLNSPLVTALKQQQADAERRAAQLQATHGAQHPQMLNARAEVGNIQARVAAEISKVIEGLGREARTADARYQALAQELRDAEEVRWARSTTRVSGLEALERDATVNRNLLEAMLLRAKQSIGAEHVLTANAKLVSPASPAQAPAYPPKALLALLGIAGGLMVGVMIALLREGGDHTFRRADQIEALTGLPVMAMVPQVAGRRGQPAMQVLRQPTSAYSEALRRLHVGIELSGTASSPKTILISSATPAEGKSVMVASLGRLLASNGKRVLLIDCDWRSPRLHQIFRCSNREGLGQPAGRQGVGPREHHSSRRLVGCRRDAVRPVEPAVGAPAELRSHAPSPRGTGAALRVHHPRRAARPGDGRRADAEPPGREGRVRGALGPHTAGGGARGAEAVRRRPGRHCRRGDVARGLQAVPPVCLRRSVLGRQEPRCERPHLNHERSLQRSVRLPLLLAGADRLGATAAISPLLAISEADRRFAGDAPTFGTRSLALALDSASGSWRIANPGH